MASVSAVVERKFEITKQSKTHFSILISGSTGTSLYFYLDGIWAAPVPSSILCHAILFFGMKSEINGPHWIQSYNLLAGRGPMLCTAETSPQF
jgi:hypothetical protein